MGFLCTMLVPTMSLSAVSSYNPEEGLKMLKEGNLRFTEGKMDNHNFTKESRESTLKMQRPFAIIITCSDSRVSPELIFDQSLGQIFVIRVAGNVVTAVEQESIDFAALYLKASLIVVLGHESCGAVTAVMENEVSSIPTIAAWIKRGISIDVSLEQAVKENVLHGMKLISKAPALEPLLKERKLKIVGGYYHLKDGCVDFF